MSADDCWNRWWRGGSCEPSRSLALCLDLPNMTQTRSPSLLHKVCSPFVFHGKKHVHMDACLKCLHTCAATSAFRNGCVAMSSRGRLACPISCEPGLQYFMPFRLTSSARQRVWTTLTVRRPSKYCLCLECSHVAPNQASRT